MTNDSENQNLSLKIIAVGQEVPSPQVSENRGQLWNSQIIARWVDTGPTIEAGSHIPPIELHTENAHGFAALHLIVHDFEFALGCFKRAYSLGRPDPANIESRAFINSGVVAYARPFVSGVRGVRLHPDMFEEVWNDQDRELHDFLKDLRDKHVAHPVNDFERCDPVGMIVFTPDGTLQEGISGVGVILQTQIGLPLQRLEAAMHHVEYCINYIKQRIDDLRPKVHADMKVDLPNGWKMAPMVKFPESVRKPRSTLPTLSNIRAWLKQPR